MDGFGLLVGHLCGDFILQNDYLARLKSTPVVSYPPALLRDMKHRPGNPKVQAEFDGLRGAVQLARVGHLACTIHCLIYTLSVWLMSFAWMPWWGLLVCFVAHWPIDRFKLARFWMENVSGQKDFANGVFAPWSIIVVDQCAHLLTLYLIALFAGRVF